MCSDFFEARLSRWHRDRSKKHNRRNETRPADTASPTDVVLDTLLFHVPTPDTATLSKEAAAQTDDSLSAEMISVRVAAVKSTETQTEVIASRKDTGALVIFTSRSSSFAQAQ